MLLKGETFTERVALPGDVPYVDESCVSFCDLESTNRCRETVEMQPTLSPSIFRNSVICYKECTRRRFISRIDYDVKLKAKQFTETSYVRPRDVVHSYVSFLEYGNNNKRRWFTTAMNLSPAASELQHQITCNGYSSDDVNNNDVSTERNTSLTFRLSNGTQIDAHSYIQRTQKGNDNRIDNDVENANVTSVRSGPFWYNVPERDPNINDQAALLNGSFRNEDHDHYHTGLPLDQHTNSRDQMEI